MWSALALLFGVLAVFVDACRPAPPSGIQISNVGPAPSTAEAGDKVRVQVNDYGVGGWSAQVARTAQAVLDMSTGSLTKLDETKWPPPPPSQYVTDTATGRFDEMTHVATISWGTGSGTFTLPNATSAMWFYSAKLDRVVFLYRTGAYGQMSWGPESDNFLATCTTNGVCQSRMVSATTQAHDLHGKVKLWDAEGLVGLPLMCCVCRTYDYYRIKLQYGQLSMESVASLNTLGASWVDPQNKLVWSASPGSATATSSLKLTRYSYSLDKASDVSLSLQQLNHLLDTAPAPVSGCVDPGAVNYDSMATVYVFGSCRYPIIGCMDSTATNYHSFNEAPCNSCCDYPSFGPPPPPPSPPPPTHHKGGCVDPHAINYDSMATFFVPGACIYPPSR